MKTNKQAAREAKQLFRLCVLNGLLDEGRVRQVVKRVIQLQYRGYLVVLSHFRRLVKLDQERRTAEVESATTLPADLQSSAATSMTAVCSPGWPPSREAFEIGKHSVLIPEGIGPT